MRVLLDEPLVHLSYGSASISCEEAYDNPALEDPWADESNGLCGAGLPGWLALQVGTHTGSVPFRIELHDDEPAYDPIWEEVVEVSFTAATGTACLTGLMGDQYAFPLPRGGYRVRYCAHGFDAADNAEEPPDSYLLLCWPGPPAPGRIVKQTAVNAAYWHRVRRALTAEERREDERAAAAERAEEAHARWGDRVPDERLRRTLDPDFGLHLSTLSHLDMDLEFALAETTDELHREIAAWAALRCLEEAGMIGLTELAPAVAALRRGEPAPPPFDEPAYCWEVLAQAEPPRTSVPVPPDSEYDQSPQDWALASVFHSADRDSLVAVMETVVCLAFVFGRDGYRYQLDAVYVRLANG